MNAPDTLKMKISDALPEILSVCLTRLTDWIEMTLRLPFPVNVVEPLMFPNVCVGVMPAASIDAARASASAWVRSITVVLPVTLKSEWMSRCAVGSRMRSPTTVDFKRSPVLWGPAPTSPTILVAPSLIVRSAPFSPRTAKLLAAPRFKPVNAFGHCWQFCWWVWSHTPWPLQPAVVQVCPSVSVQGVLSLANMCVCTHTPRSGLVPLTSQPASVQALLSVSVHGVLTFGVHCPLVVSQPPLHSSVGGHVLLAWVWSHTPAPLQPAVVHALPSVSGHGTLSCWNMWFCAHTPRSGLVGLSSQPAIVQMLPSVSVHGVLVFGVHCPLVASPPPLH